MINRLTGRYCKPLALFFMLLMYGELAATLYAGRYWHRQQQEILAKSDHRSSVVNSYVIKELTSNKSIQDSRQEADKIALPAEEPLIIDATVSEETPEDIGGPGQPEMAAFKSASVDNMVNMFTGDFSYNIPLIDLGGYPVNLFYSGGVGMDQDASWVGLGWNLNPGTISRNMRGLPDDYDGDEVIKVQHMKNDRTIGVTGSTSAEFTGVPANLGLSAGIYYNNRRGLGLRAGGSYDFGALTLLSLHACDEKTLWDSVKRLSKYDAGVSLALDLNSQEGMSASVGLSGYISNKERDIKHGLSTSVNYQSRQGLTDINIQAEKYKYRVVQEKDDYFLRTSPLRVSSNISFARTSFTPTIRMPLTRSNHLFALKLGTERTALFKSGIVSGFVQDAKIDDQDTMQRKPGYGYMHYAKAEDNRNALMDFNRINDGSYNHKTPIISVPVYTYDVFTINGEGTGGSFRGYHSNPGFVKDNVTRSRSGSFNFTLDLGVKKIFHGGSSIGGTYSNSTSEEWRVNNGLRAVTKLKETDGLYEGFYFRNPGEMAIIDEEYYNKLGGDQLIRPYLINTKTASATLAGGYRALDEEKKLGDIYPVNASTVRQTRDKRTQVITFLTAEDASNIGLDKLIYSYTENMFKPGVCEDPVYRNGITRFSTEGGYRKSHHISQVNVLESDGRRYVYGIPVYQSLQKEVSFSVEGTPNDKQLVSYTSAGTSPDNSVFNNKGRDGYYQREELKGYAHSFLLTGILSPDYVDVTGDGITDDDLGTAVKFNYSRINRQAFPTGLGADISYWYPFRWRVPVEANMASYNEGLKADDRDDKALYTYGEKELWYLHSIESKNMVAMFYTSSRNDGKQVLGENGGISASLLRLQKLDSIRVFTKADYLKNPAKARPIKTVHFKYSYKLCQSYPLNGALAEKGGKLTLDSIWFSYNGYSRVKKNKYAFRYGAVSAGDIVNPSYNPSHSDRWGNYKPASANPATLPNKDYPYSTQNETDANRFAYAWNLTDILLPSGGTISVKYEADDYAFVQDKRASQMYAIAGFAKEATHEPTNQLYSYSSARPEEKANPALADHRFIFFDVASPLANKNAIATTYLQDFKQLLLKISVEMPRGNIGENKAFETVIIYAAIKDYDLAYDDSEPDGRNHSRFYIELEPTRREGSPIMQTVMQFLKDQLPHRAYPGYQVNGDGPIREVVRAVLGLFDGLQKGILGFEKDLKLYRKCQDVALSHCFARLNSPAYKKKGGGHRVKSITIGDNWSKLLKRTDESAKLDSYYGQEYDYTTLEEVDGVPTVISSGVATYEPGVGNEENPFREVAQFTTRQPLGPTEVGNIELPFAETFYPSPMIGYSRVTVRSIHNKSNKRVKAGVGLQQTNFYTTRDFPVREDYTSFDQESRSHHKPALINKVFNFNKKEYVTLAQGFRVVLNDMNGKVKSQASFPENDYKTPINFTAYRYRVIEKGDGKYKLDNRVPVISGPDGVISYKMIGKDVEVMNDFREHMTITRSAQIPLNVDLFTISSIPVLIPTFFRMAFHDEARYRAATTLKVVQEFGILDSVLVVDKGSVMGTKNMVYDAETGDALLTRTNNEFKDPVYQFSYPARWVESGMEPAYRNIDMLYKGVLFRNGLIEAGPSGMLDNFESGDEIYIVESDREGPQENPACVVAGYPVRIPASDERLIWAVDVQKDDRNTTKKFIFLDRYGKPFNAVNATIRVVRSGKRNMISASVGNVTSLINPLQVVSGVEKIVINNAANVLSAAAVEFKEKWRANDQFYSQDTTVVTVRQTPLHSVTLSPANTYSGIREKRYSTRATTFYEGIANGAFETFKSRDQKNSTRYNYDQNSWAKFNLPSEMAGATVYDAKLVLPGHNSAHTGAPLAMANHIFMKPHNQFDANDHAATMTMKISRMTSPWYSSSANSSWQQIFDDNAQQDLINNYVIYTPPFILHKTQFTGDYTLNVRSLMQAMVNNYGSGTQASGIKLGFYKNSFEINAHNKGTPYRFCFAAYGNMTPPNCIDCTPNLMKIQVSYFKCNESDLVVYEGGTSDAPVTAPDGYVYCTEAVTGKMCFSTFSKKQMNPYIQGVLGNWRPYRSYVFYGERKNKQVSEETDLRTDGALNNFVHYWAFDETNIRLQRSGNTQWVWNSEVTQYNRRGAELENHDPLDRYNAGIYGYQETLPVAVINNARLRLTAFDGFEDYDYKDEPCEPYCKPSKRHFNTGITTAQLVQTESHSGRYSLKVTANSSVSVDMKASTDDRVINPDLRIKADAITEVEITQVNPRGIGLKAQYYNDLTFTTPVVTRTEPSINLSFKGDNSDDGSRCSDRGNLPAGVNCNRITVKWTGKIQVTRTGWYVFDVSSVDDEALIHVTDAGNVSVQVTSVHYNSPKALAPVYLEAGTLHTIEVKYLQNSYTGRMNLLWRQPKADGNQDESTPFTSIPSYHFYPEGQESLATGSVVTSTMYCIKPDTIQAINHHLIDSFNLVPGTKMLASIWVKKGGMDCNCSTYEGLDLKIKNSAGGDVAIFQPKEKVIEGWQQFEAVFTVPAGHNKLVLELNAPSDKDLYVDDLRLHPFNANMKSFVYDPVNLRLVAELDENNFAAFYEYDDEGTLIRTKKETRLGVKTITETRSAIQKEVKDL